MIHISELGHVVCQLAYVDKNIKLLSMRMELLNKIQHCIRGAAIIDLAAGCPLRLVWKLGLSLAHQKSFESSRGR